MVRAFSIAGTSFFPTERPEIMVADFIFHHSCHSELSEESCLTLLSSPSVFEGLPAAQNTLWQAGNFNMLIKIPAA
jgi:hypothetical protein